MITSNIDLKPYNTFGISAKAKGFAKFSNVEELQNIFKEIKDQKFMILGGGSNILFTQDFDGVIIKNEMTGIEIIQDSKEDVLIKAGAGENWHSFVLHTIDIGLGGIENLSLIPGNVGASPMQNIGAYGREIKDVFESLEAYHIETGEVHTFDNSSCEFGYRESVFKRKLKNQYVILNVTYRLSRKHRINSSYGAINDELNSKGIDQPTIKDISNAVIAIRSSKLPNPNEIGNAGSFFKNPVVEKSDLEKIQRHYESVPNYPAGDKVKLAAGWLIEQAGWKGYTDTNFGVHKKQALVLVNYGGAEGQDIYDLSTKIVEDVYSKFGVQLEREVNIM